MNRNVNEIVKNVSKLMKARSPKTLGRHKFFSVMILLVEAEGKLNILYQMRSPKLQTQPNEISFPGGRIEENEDSKEAALRETYEEIGIPKEKITYLGEGDRVTTVAEFTIFSHIGYIDENTYKSIKLNEAEVSEVFLVPISFFIENKPQIHIFDIVQHSEKEFPYELVKISPEYRFYSSKVEVPIYPLSEEKTIWGLTGRLTRAFIELLKNEKII